YPRPRKRHPGRRCEVFANALVRDGYGRSWNRAMVGGVVWHVNQGSEVGVSRRITVATSPLLQNPSMSAIALIATISVGVKRGSNDHCVSSSPFCPVSLNVADDHGPSHPSVGTGECPLQKVFGRIV